MHAERVMYKVFGIVIVKAKAGSFKACISKTDWYKGKLGRVLG